MSADRQDGEHPAVRVSVAHTADLDARMIAASRALMYEVFDDMTELDWEHALGGMHAIATADGEVVGHASVIQRRLLHGGRSLRAGYVEAVGVRSAYRRAGVGSALMEPLERIIRSAFDLGALGATDDAMPFYGARGWQAWRGPASALTPAGIVATPDEQGAIYVLASGVALDVDAELTCDWRDGDVW
ncbi:MAG TPA: GNAT family N-acetyltransferase [Jatrophihabitantaceae bacterium]|jgi:aminoglycoside 2'-N-acetyltransferase I|nr:GNAT family N-acetyltransferase [Jatrophihabitantaceae bacterium]